jgi:cation transporter-like permease
VSGCWSLVLVVVYIVVAVYVAIAWWRSGRDPYD